MRWKEEGQKKCPFCKTDAIVGENTDTGQLAYTDCLCGKYCIDMNPRDDASYDASLKTDEDKILFSGYLRNNQSSQKDNQPITITDEFVREELPGILDYCKEKTLDEKISKIKSYIYQKTASIGQHVQLEVEKLYTFFYLKTHSELVAILKYLQESNILHKTPVDTNTIVNVILTIEGFSKIESTQKNYLQSKKVFIACEFDTGYQDKLVKTIKAACAACGFDAKLVSDERHDKDITHKIIADLKQSRFIIADFTDQNNGVYYEAGYAMGMSKKVIRLVNEKQIKKLHFDTRQFSHIPWKDGKWKELEDDLINQIKVTVLNNHDTTE